MKCSHHVFWGVLILSLVGCSSCTSSTRLDLTLFAESMITIAGDIQYGLAEQQVVYLREYANLPEVDELEVWAGKVRDIIQGTIAYSIEIVTLAESELSDPERTEM